MNSYFYVLWLSTVVYPSILCYSTINNTYLSLLKKITQLWKWFFLPKKEEEIRCPHHASQPQKRYNSWRGPTSNINPIHIHIHIEPMWTELFQTNLSTFPSGCPCGNLQTEAKYLSWCWVDEHINVEWMAT